MSDDENMQKPWGEMDPEPMDPMAENEKRIFLDICKNIWLSSPVVEGREMFVPPQAPPTKVIYSTECKDYISLHNIQLQLFIDKMEQMIENASVMEFDDAVASTSAGLPPAPELPPMHPDCILHKKRPGDRTGVNPEKRDFVVPKDVALIRVPMRVVREQLEVAIAAFLGNIGFTTGTRSAIDVFTDVLHEWLKRMTRLLRMNVDREALTGECVGRDVLEQTLIEGGISGGYEALIEYYEEQILGRHDNLLAKCKSLVDQYEKLRNPVIETKEEEIIDNLEVTAGVEFPDVPIDEEEAMQPVPFEYEELQGALQNNPPEGSNLMKGDDWPIYSSKNEFL